jgi:hypothetical protein
MVLRLVTWAFHDADADTPAAEEVEVMNQTYALHVCHVELEHVRLSHHVLMRCDKHELHRRLGVDFLNREIGFVSFVRVCVCVQRGTRSMRQSGLGFPSPLVATAVGVDLAWPWARLEGTDLGAVVGVAVGVDTAASAAVGPPNLPICLRGALDKSCTTQSFSYTGLNAI